MSQLKQFKLPDVGEGLTEADIVKWHVKPGDQVVINQIIVEIETAKAVVELPSPYAGVVAGLLVAEGTTADVGTPIISVRVGDESELEAALQADVEAGIESGVEAGLAAGLEAGLEAGLPAGLAAGEGAEADGKVVLVGYGVMPETAARRARGPAPGAGAPASQVLTGQAREGEGSAGPAAAQARALAKPPVRKLARELGVDLARIAGSGPGGSVTRADVQAAASAVPAGAGPASRPGMARTASLPREERIQVRGVRKHTAAAVSASAFTAPHVTEFLQIDITATMDATARLKSLPEFNDIRVSPLLLVARALLIAAARHPMINSSWDGAAEEIVVRHYVNLGIAAATDRGLIVPNVKDAHALSLPELAGELARLAENARASRATPADLTGGTITITNVGVFGVDSGTPIISPGEAAILAFGQVKAAPWVHEGQLAVRQVCTLALSFDHRVVDGDLGSAVLRDVGAMLTDPLRMLAWS